MGKASPLQAVLVEAFSERPLAGNGAGVVRLREPAERSWMQAVATRLQQSETAFLLPWRDEWALRWFTPSCEVPLCGHGTLAALVALGHWGELGTGCPLRLHTRSGPLTVERQTEGLGGTIELPAGGLVPAAPSAALRQLLQTHLQVQPERTWDSPLGYRVVLLPEDADLASMGSIAAELQGIERQGLVLMQAAAARSQRMVMGQRADYQLRFFAPGLGIDEDPVTGSAHALVAPYWLACLNKAAVVGWQCAANGGGLIAEAASSGMIRLQGRGHLLWDGCLDAGSVGACRQDWEEWLSGV